MSLSATLARLARCAKNPSERGLLMELSGEADRQESQLSILRSTGRQVADLVRRCELYGPADALRERARLLEAVCAVDAKGATPFDDVKAFHKLLFQAPDCPTWVPSETLALRIALVNEEARELCDAMRSGVLAEVAREGVDLLYVTYGAFVDHGLRPEPFWEAVHAANMKKERDPAGGKAIKPPGWQKPDLKTIYERQCP